MKLDKFIAFVLKNIDQNFLDDAFYESLISFDWINIDGQCIYPLHDYMNCNSLAKLIANINAEAKLAYHEDNYWELDEQNDDQNA